MSGSRCLRDPVVVTLDWADADSVVYCLREMYRRDGGDHRLRIAAQIRGRTRPAEPKHRYAVVIDTSGSEWLRDKQGNWFRTSSNGKTQTGWEWREWPDIDAERVISEGVTP